MPTEVRMDRGPMLAAYAAAGLWIAAGALLGVGQVFGSEFAFRRAELVGHIAFGAMYTLPGVLVLCAWRRRELLLSAACCGFLLSIGAWSLAPIFLILTLLILWAFSRVSDAQTPRAGLAAIAAVVLLAGAYGAQMAHADPRCYSFVRDASGQTRYVVGPGQGGDGNFGTSYATASSDGSAHGGGCSSDITTPAEGLVSLAIAASIPFVTRRIVGRRAAPIFSAEGHA